MLLCDWRAHLQTGLCQGLKRSRDPWGPEARLELLVRAMIPQFWACCLFSLFLVGFAQPTPKQQQMKVDCYKGVTGTIYEYGALALNGEEYIQFKQYVRPGGGFVPNFQLFEKGDVNGEKEQKVFSFLKNSCPPTSDFLGSSSQLFWEPMKVHDIRWNFEKFLVGPDGVPIIRWFHRASISTVKSDILEYMKQFKSK
ncbi:hypothetical protein J1605_017724 [Eschrichtius robustus]|uniref:Glutathione peroxidase n=1 Tax=Eschrichtius robustus TaxID=9764 RepID=A0AB34I0T1_ESCRO|nr:hypothetical protein J1605_017724 [Eschrichtius robustus]